MRRARCWFHAELLRHTPGSIAWSALLLSTRANLPDSLPGRSHAVSATLLECDLGGMTRQSEGCAGGGCVATDLSGVGGAGVVAVDASDYRRAELVHACYVGHADAQINDQYRSLHGSLRFLHNIVRFPDAASLAGLLLDAAQRRAARWRGMCALFAGGEKVVHSAVCVCAGLSVAACRALLDGAHGAADAGFEAITLPTEGTTA